MTSGWKIGIGITSLLVIAGGSVIIYRAVKGFKEKEVRDAEKEQFGSLGSLIEIGRKKHPELAEWYDSMSLNQLTLIEDGWNAMSDLQKDKIYKGVKSNNLPEDVANFFRKKGAKV